LTSGVIAKGLEQGLVSQQVHTRHQTTATLLYRQANPTVLRGICFRAKSQLPTFLDQAIQARALVGSKRFGIGEKLIVEIRGGLHGKVIQISVLAAQGPRRGPIHTEDPCHDACRSDVRKQPAVSGSCWPHTEFRVLPQSRRPTRLPAGVV
jgi:hypothetical protein